MSAPDDAPTAAAPVAEPAAAAPAPADSTAATKPPPADTTAAGASTDAPATSSGDAAAAEASQAQPQQQPQQQPQPPAGPRSPAPPASRRASSTMPAAGASNYAPPTTPGKGAVRGGASSTSTSTSSGASPRRQGTDRASMTSTGALPSTGTGTVAASASGDGYRSVKEVEAEAAAMAEEVLKFRKAQAAQRSPQWQLEELSRLFAKQEQQQQALGACFAALTRDKDNQKRQVRALTRDMAAMRADLAALAKARADAEAEHAAAIEAERAGAAGVENELRADAAARAAERRALEEQVAALEKALQQERALRVANENTLQGAQEQLEQRLAATENEVRLREADTAGERRDHRATRVELQEKTQCVEDLRDELARVSGKLEDAQRTVAELRPWEVKYHGLHDRADKAERELTARCAAAETQARSYRTILRYVIKTQFGNNLRLRVAVCAAHARASSLLLTATAEVDKLRQIAKPGALPTAESSPPAVMGPEALADRFVPLASPVWDRALQSAVAKKRAGIRKMLTGIKSWGLGKLVEALDGEVARLVEPVEVLSRRLWSFYNTCVSLGQASIQKTGDHLEADIAFADLRREHAKVVGELEETKAARDREKAAHQAALAKLHILEREVAQSNRARKHAQHVEALLHSHGKLQSVQEQLALTKQRIKQLKDEQNDQAELLTSMQQQQQQYNQQQQQAQQAQQQQGGKRGGGGGGGGSHSPARRTTLGPYDGPAPAPPGSSSGGNGSTSGGGKTPLMLPRVHNNNNNTSTNTSTGASGNAQAPRTGSEGEHSNQQQQQGSSRGPRRGTSSSSSPLPPIRSSGAAGSAAHARGGEAGTVRGASNNNNNNSDDDDDEEEEEDDEEQLPASQVLLRGPESEGFDDALVASLALLDKLSAAKRGKGGDAANASNGTGSGRRTAAEDARSFWEAGAPVSHKDQQHARRRQQQQQQQQQQLQQRAATGGAAPAASNGGNSARRPAGSVYRNGGLGFQPPAAAGNGNGGGSRPAPVLTQAQLALLQKQNKLMQETQ